MRTGPPGVFNELFRSHFLFLLGVVSIGRKHDDGVGQRKEFVCVVVSIGVALVESQSELPDDSFDLLRLPRQPELAH